MQTVVVLAVILSAVCWLVAGWRAGMLLLTGATVSLASLWEWQRLVAVINARMDNQQPPRSTSLVVAMFFLRLSVAGLLIYGSLKCFQGAGYGPIYALAGGLCLAIVGLGIQAFKMLIF
jgi:hypothetical protein